MAWVSVFTAVLAVVTLRAEFTIALMLVVVIPYAPVNINRSKLILVHASRGSFLLQIMGKIAQRTAYQILVVGPMHNAIMDRALAIWATTRQTATAWHVFRQCLTV